MNSDEVVQGVSAPLSASALLMITCGYVYLRLLGHQNAGHDYRPEMI